MNLHPHRCAATGCQRSIPGAKLMCIDHWRMVPEPIKRDVYASWRGLGNPRLQGYMVRLKVYRKAVADAVAAVEAKQLAKQIRIAEVEGDLFPRTPADSREQNSNGNPRTTPTEHRAEQSSGGPERAD